MRITAIWPQWSRAAWRDMWTHFLQWHALNHVLMGLKIGFQHIGPRLGRRFYMEVRAWTKAWAANAKYAFKKIGTVFTITTFCCRCCSFVSRFLSSDCLMGSDSIKDLVWMVFCVFYTYHQLSWETENQYLTFIKHVYIKPLLLNRLIAK